MKKENKIAIFSLIILWGVFFWGILSGKYFLWEDLLYQFYPFRYMGADSFSKFGLLFWNNTIFGGVPFLDNVQIAQFYPFNIILNIYCFFTGPLSYKTFEIFVLLHVLVASISTFFAFRILNKNTYISLFGAIIYSYSSFFIMHVIHLSFMQTMLFAPMIIALMISYNKKATYKKGVWISILTATSFLGGYAQYLYYFGFFILGLFIYQNINTIKNKDWKILIKKSFIFKFLVIGIFISFIQWLPANDMVNSTRREKLTIEKSEISSVAPKNLIRFITPNFFGKMTQSKPSIYYDQKKGYMPFWASDKGGFEYWETSLSFGIIPLALLILYMIFGAKKRDKIIFSSFLIFLILLSMGKYTPVYKFIFNIVPGVDKFRNTGRFSFFITLFSTILITIRFNKILDLIKNLNLKKIIITILSLTTISYIIFLNTKFPIQPAKDAAFASISLAIFISLTFATLVILFKKDFIKKTTFTILIIITTFIELYATNSQFVLGQKNGDTFFRRDLNTTQLKNKNNPFRISTRNSKGMLLPRNSGMVLGLETTEGYDPLMLKTWLSYWFEINWKHKKEIFNTKLTIADNGRGLKELKNVFPRYFITNNIYEINHTKDLKKFNADSLFELGKTFAIIKKTDQKRINSKNKINYSISNISNKRPDYKSIKIKCNNDGILVNNTLFYKRWKILVDNKSVKKFMVNGVAIGTYIKKGEHIVTYYYDKSIFFIGLLISLLSILFLFSINFIYKKFHFNLYDE